MAFFGDQRNLPARLSNYANKESILYWSTPRDQPLCVVMSCEVAGPCVFLPCAWPHLLILSPCLCCWACNTKSKQLGIIAVLTTTSLELIERDGTVNRRIHLEHIQNIIATTQSQESCVATCCMPDVNRLIIRQSSPSGPGSLETILWGHGSIVEFRRLILEAKERRSQMINVPAAQMMTMPQIQQPVMLQQPIMMQQPMMLQQPMMIHSPGQPYPSNQQQPMAYGQPMMQQPMAYGQSVVYGQPMIQQPYSYTPSFAYATQVHPEPMNSNPGESKDPKR